jgi:hypothetical protein
MRYLKAYSEHQLIEHRRNEDVRNELQTFDLNARNVTSWSCCKTGGTERNRFMNDFGAAIPEVEEAIGHPRKSWTDGLNIIFTILYIDAGTSL